MSNENCTQGRLIFPQLAQTPQKSIITDLVTAMLGWNTMVAPNSCCALHHNVRMMVSLADEMRLSECSNLGYDHPIQCTVCGLVDEFAGEPVPERCICR